MQSKNLSHIADTGTDTAITMTNVESAEIKGLEFKYNTKVIY